MSAPVISNAMQPLQVAASRPSDGLKDVKDRHIFTRQSAASLLRSLLREPLIHFAVLGAVIFAADGLLHPPAKDEKVITVTKALRQSFIDGFDEDKERVPSAADLQKMVDAWVASEILYREGKALGVDRGDEMIRDRVAFKLQLLIFDQVRVASPTDEQLRSWFADNHARFDTPERVGFYLTAPADRATAERQLADIAAQRESEDLREQTRAILGRPIDSLAAAFGDSFRDALLAMPQGEWHLLRSKDGWHVVRLDSRTPGVPAKLDDVRDDAEKMWHTDETRRQAWDAVNRLKASYKIRYEP
jgi:hypothetical protein